MCGISGFQGTFDHHLLPRMNQLIAHRGPDASGAYHDSEAIVGLSHRRLSIIDLSSLGKQPMWEWTGLLGNVCDAKIYNCQEL